MNRIHAKLGDLWWYTILLFCAQRFGDVINMFVGLWIVPKYVPMEELGAVMPLTNIVSVIGIPLTIIAIPFLKFVAVFAEKKEFGKVKALIRDTFIGTGIFTLLTILIAYFILPLFFERLRVENGSLAFLLVATTIITAVSTITGNAVSALKMFSQTIWYSAIAAPLRLILMIVLMPFRPLSGYVVGGAALPAVGVIGPLFALRKFFKSGIKAEPYWKEHGRDILKYTWPLIIMTMINAVTSNMDTLVIRHRLNDFESAGYYIVTRFSDISLQLGSVFVAFLMPLLADRNGNDSELRKLVTHSLIGILISGFAIAMLLLFWGAPILELKPEWSIYKSLSFHMVGFAFLGTLATANSCITTSLIARSNFSFLWIKMSLITVRSFFLYSLTGYTYFSNILPNGVITAIEQFNPCRLSVILWTMLIVEFITLPYLLVMAFRRKTSIH